LPDVKKDLRIHSTTVRLSAEELHRLERYAERERLNLSTAIRRAMLLEAERAEQLERATGTD
jgi:hypothetical protein